MVTTYGIEPAINVELLKQGELSWNIGTTNKRAYTDLGWSFTEHLKAVAGLSTPYDDIGKLEGYVGVRIEF